jgi:hypothetical protein
MALVFDAACESAVADVRSDATSTNWVAFKYEGRNKLLVGAKGSNGSVEKTNLIAFGIQSRFSSKFHA